MAIDYHSYHAAGVLAVQDSMGDNCPTFTWNSQTYKANPGGAMKKKANSTGGFTLDADLAITVHIAQFGDITAQALRDRLLKTSLTYLGTNYRVESVTIFTGAKLIRIECNDPAQPA